MSVKIRCRRTGANNDPCFRIVAADTRFPRDGKYLEILGWYDPKKKENGFSLKMERIEAWRSKGAQISEIVKSLMRKTRAINKLPVTKEAPPKVDVPKSEDKPEPTVALSKDAENVQDKSSPKVDVPKSEDKPEPAVALSKDAENVQDKSS